MSPFAQGKHSSTSKVWDGCENPLKYNALLVLTTNIVFFLLMELGDWMSFKRKFKTSFTTSKRLNSSFKTKSSFVGWLDFFLVNYWLEMVDKWSLQHPAKNSSYPKEKSRLLNECFKHNLQHCVFKSRIVTRKRLCQKQNRAVIIFIKAQMNRKFYFLSCEEEVVTMLTRFCFIPISNWATYIYDIPLDFPLFGKHFLMWTKNHDIIVV